MERPEKPYIDFDWSCIWCKRTITPFFDYESEKQYERPEICPSCKGNEFEITNRVVS